MTMPEGELRTLEYNPEREREELIQKAAKGVKYKAALEVLDEVIDAQRESVINNLETQVFENDSDAIGLIVYLRVLKKFRNIIETRITEGGLAEKELRENGD